MSAVGRRDFTGMTCSAGRARKEPRSLSSGAREFDDDPRDRQREMHRAHEAFLTLGSDLDPKRDSVRPIVLESWQRALSLGVDPDRALAPVDCATADLERLRESHPLSSVIHVIRRLLGDDAEDSGHLMAITDATGVLLWVEGAHALRSKAEAMNFVEGARWSEDCAGTNAPGDSARPRPPGPGLCVRALQPHRAAMDVLGRPHP